MVGVTRSRLRSTSTNPNVGVGLPGSSMGRGVGGGRLDTSRAAMTAEKTF